MLNMCFLSAVSLGYVCVPPRQAPIEGSPESFWDSANPSSRNMFNIICERCEKENVGHISLMLANPS